jgi:ribosome-binding factor A
VTRVDRLAELIKQEVSDILRAEVADPRIGFVSLTEVSLSPDFKDCRVYVSVYGDDQQKNEAMAGLRSATGFIRAKLAGMLEIRTIPELHFLRDDSIERGSRVLKLLKDEAKILKPNKKNPKKR